MQASGAERNQVFGSGSLAARVCYILAMVGCWRGEQLQVMQTAEIEGVRKIISFETDSVRANCQFASSWGIVGELAR